MCTIVILTYEDNDKHSIEHVTSVLNSFQLSFCENLFRFKLFLLQK